MHDFKHMHTSNQSAPTPQQRNPALEYIGIAALTVGTAYSVMYVALVQLTGGF